MVDVCPRCEAVLPRVDGDTGSFCSNCGLPQLRVSQALLDAADAQTAAPDAAGGVLGRGPIDSVAFSAGSRGDLDWPALLPILLAGTAVGLLPCLFMRDVLFSGAAGIPVLFLMPVLCLASGYTYQRRRPLAGMSAGNGARMGLALGTLLASAVTTVTAIAAFALRYGRHNRSLQQNFDGVMQQAEAQVRANQPGAPEPLLQAMRSPEWHAGWFLTMQGGLMLLLMATGLIAGLVAGALLRARQQTLRTDQ